MMKKEIITSLKPHEPMEYTPFGLDLLDCEAPDLAEIEKAAEAEKKEILTLLEENDFKGFAIDKVVYGPIVSKYYFIVPEKIKIKSAVLKIEMIFDLLYSERNVKIYIDYVSSCIVMEIPNKNRKRVTLGGVLKGLDASQQKPEALVYALGKDMENNDVFGDISKEIHLLIGGTTQSRKENFLHSIIQSLTYQYSPEKVRFILMDMKDSEFKAYKNLPHLLFNEIITDCEKALKALEWARAEMDRRYLLLNEMSMNGTYVVNIGMYNKNVSAENRLPSIVIFIDELAYLMLYSKKRTEECIQCLTQKSRAAGIHLVVATQRNKSDVITGVISVNIPTRISFSTPSELDSRILLNEKGAERLLPENDFMYKNPGMLYAVRLHNGYISQKEIKNTVAFLKNNNEKYYDAAAKKYIENTQPQPPMTTKQEQEKERIEALRTVIITGNASISCLQRKLNCGYNKAGQLVEWMEEEGYISPFDGAKSRTIYITKEEFEKKFGEL